MVVPFTGYVVEKLCWVFKLRFFARSCTARCRRVVHECRSYWEWGTASKCRRQSLYLSSGELERKRNILDTSVFECRPRNWYFFFLLLFLLESRSSQMWQTVPVPRGDLFYLFLFAVHLMVREIAQPLYTKRFWMYERVLAKRLPEYTWEYLKESSAKSSTDWKSIMSIVSLLVASTVLRRKRDGEIYIMGCIARALSFPISGWF